jgi:hypothetical protein
MSLVYVCGGGDGVVFSELCECSEGSEFGVWSKCRSCVFSVVGRAWY